MFNLLCRECQQWVISENDKYCGFCGCFIKGKFEQIDINYDNCIQNIIDIPHNAFKESCDMSFKVIDFGLVNSPDSPVQTIQFLTNNIDHDTQLLFNTSASIKENLSLEIINNNTIKVRLENISQSGNGNRIIEYNGHGISISTIANKYNIKIPVSFKRVSPELKLNKSLIDFGYINIKNQNIGRFKIFNNGNGRLRISIVPIKNVIFNTSTSQLIEPGQNIDIQFELWFQDNTLETEFEKFIIIKTNEPEIRPVHYVKLKGYIS